MHASQRFTLLLAFAFSGCTGLIYESVWSHYLGLYLGHAAYAQTLTLIIFMGGMTLGAYLTSRYIGRLRNALMGYAAAEMLLGMAAIVFHLVYTSLIDFSYTTAFPGLGNSTSIEIYKWASGAAMILPQSILLGATFPLLCSALIRREQQAVGEHISLLYFINSFGAAAGALIATFLLIPKIGMPGAMSVAGVINLLIAIVVYLIAKRPEPYSAANSTSAGDRQLVRVTAIVLIAALITGAVSFVYEIAWIRMLNLVLGTSFHAFEIMLSAFIAGLALGGFWIKSRIEKIANLLRFTGLVQIFMGMAAISTLILYDQSFAWVASLLNEGIQRTDTGYLFYNIATSLIAALIMIPAAFCAGMTLPLLTTHLLRNGLSERAIGRVYAANTIGAISGIVIAVHLGLALLGLKWLIVAAGVVDIALGIYLVAYTGFSFNGISIRYRIAAVAMAALVSLSLVTEISPERLASGTFRYARAEMSNEIIYYKDGKTASISVDLNAFGQAGISTNGKPDAALMLQFDPDNPNPSSDEVTMAMLGSIAQMIDPTIQQVANIGFGSGLTSHILLASPQIKSLDTIEIEPLIIEAAKLFKSRNSRAYDDARSNIHIDDAKSFFAARQKKYDAIISEPSNPWVMGVGNLFSVEFYHQLQRYLQPEGIFVQWLHLYEISLPTLLTALNALSQNFAQIDLYSANAGDLIIVASQHSEKNMGINVTWDQLAEPLKRELKLVGIDNIDAIKTRKILSKPAIDALIQSMAAKTNSDYFPILSLNAPRDRFKLANSDEIFNLARLGIHDNIYKNKTLNGSHKLADQYHLWENDIRQLRGLEQVLPGNQSMGLLDAEFRGFVQTFIQPGDYCKTPDARESWLEAFHRVATQTNDFGSDALRQKVREYASQFDCANRLRSASALMYRSLIISLADLSADSNRKFRHILFALGASNAPENYRSFIISCYLLGLIKHSDSVNSEDYLTLETIERDFDFNNRWLEALLRQKLAS